MVRENHYRYYGQHGKEFTNVNGDVEPATRTDRDARIYRVNLSNIETLD